MNKYDAAGFFDFSAKFIQFQKSFETGHAV
jgi:hypothetical protein